VFIGIIAYTIALGILGMVFLGACLLFNPFSLIRDRNYEVRYDSTAAISLLISIGYIHMKRVLPFFLIGTGFLLSTLMVGVLLVNNSVENPGAAPLPQELSGIQLTRYSTGKSASTEVIRLHENSFLVTSAAVGTYGRDQVVIWVTGTPSRIIAGRQVAEMEEKIGVSNAPFTPINVLRDGHRHVYELSGMGQQHFYFQSGRLVVWLAVNEDLAERVLDAALAFYR
jgi:hypothetical protein